MARNSLMIVQPESVLGWAGVNNRCTKPVQRKVSGLCFRTARQKLRIRNFQTALSALVLISGSGSLKRFLRLQLLGGSRRR